MHFVRKGTSTCQKKSLKVQLWGVHGMNRVPFGWLLVFWQLPQNQNESPTKSVRLVLVEAQILVPESDFCSLFG